jgi:HEAT repeat protein
MFKVLIYLAAGLLTLTIGVYGYSALSGRGDKLPPAAKLADQALTASTPDAREKAALDLARFGQGAEPHLRRVLTESTQASVKAAVIQGLAALGDWESMPQLIDALEDADAQVQGRAQAAVTHLLGKDFFFRPADEPLDVAVAIRGVRAEYERIRTSPSPKFRRN